MRFAQEIASNVAVIRKQRGIAASALATIIGVSRQTVYAIEAGTYVPNTAVALRLARALQTTVEELFRLPDPVRTKQPEEIATLLAGCEESKPGEAVQLCDVNGRLMAVPANPASWLFPASDGVMTGVVRNRARIRLHNQLDNSLQNELGNRILIAGCDPAMALLARHLAHYRIELVLAQRNSSQSLALLKQGQIHIAGTHLRDETGESNVHAINRLFPADTLAVITFAMWEEGIVVANGNPKAIHGVQDLARKKVKFLNREAGAGSRLLLDAELKRLGLESARVRGYGQTATGHLAAAQQVKTGAVDCCIATGAAARFFGLGFVPLQTSRYDLALRKDNRNLPGIGALFDAITRSAFRDQLSGVAGYDTEQTGQSITLSESL